MDFKRLNEELQKYLSINEISDGLKQRVIDARKQQLADLEKQTNDTTKDFDKKLADKEREKEKNLKHKTAFANKLYKPVPLCKINGSLVQWEFFYPKEGRYTDNLIFKMTGLPIFSNTHDYDFITQTTHGEEGSPMRYYNDGFSKKDYYKCLCIYLNNNLAEINSIEIIDNELKGIFFKNFGYHVADLEKDQEFLQKCPDLKYYAQYAFKNESYEINEISDGLVYDALIKARRNFEWSKDDMEKLNKQKETHIKNSQDKLNKLRNKIKDLEGIRDKKDIQ